MSNLLTVTTPRCMVCGQAAQVEVDSAGYEKWKRGTLIQAALPTLSRAERELLITGTHDECWKLMSAQDEADE